MKKYLLLSTLFIAGITNQTFADNHAADDSLRIILSDTVIITTPINKDVIAVDEDGVKIDLRRKNKSTSDQDIVLDKISDDDDTINGLDGLEELVNVFSKKSKVERIFKVDMLMMDIGLNGFMDNTDY